MVTQQIALGKKPHIVVATPGRLMDHLENTKGFSLRTLKFLVMDEADRLLDLDFGMIIDKILKVLPRERRTFLFSATMSSKVESLQRASLKNPLRVSVSSSSHQTVKTLVQSFLFIPHKFKDMYLVYLLNEFTGKTCIIFTRTVNETQRIALLTRALVSHTLCDLTASYADDPCRALAPSPCTGNCLSLRGWGPWRNSVADLA